MEQTTVKRKLISKLTSELLIKYVFLPTRVDHKRYLTSILLGVVIVSCLILAILSLPPITKLIWNYVFTHMDRESITATKEFTKAWLNSISYVLDIIVALFIGGSIFGERLAAKFKNKIIEYENVRDIILDKRQEVIETHLQESVANIIKLARQRGWKQQLCALPKLSKECRRLYSLAFGNLPNFYKQYLRFVLYSSFPGGLYGLNAFGAFFASCVLKLIVIYLDSPHLA